MAMVPNNVAEQDIANGKISEETQENLQEIMNIAASMFNKAGMPHTRFGTLYLTTEGELPEEILEILKAPSARADFNVEMKVTLVSVIRGEMKQYVVRRIFEHRI